MHLNFCTITNSKTKQKRSMFLIYKDVDFILVLEPLHCELFINFGWKWSKLDF